MSLPASIYTLPFWSYSLHGAPQSDQGYEEAILKFRENPEVDEPEEEVEEDAAAPTEKKSAPKRDRPAAAAAEDGDSDDSMDWGNDDDDDSDDDDLVGGAGRAPGDFPYTAEMFLKKKAGDDATEIDIRPKYFEQVEDMAEDLENAYNVELDVPFGEPEEIAEQKITIKGNKLDVRECMRELSEKLGIQVYCNPPRAD